MPLKTWLAGWIGDRGERAAVRYLKRQGLKIIGRRYRNTLGEIDILARDSDVLVFVEVKTRRSEKAGPPETAVDFVKQRQLSRAAAAFVHAHRLHDLRTRFDVVAVFWPTGVKHPEIRWLKDAFPPTE